MRVFSIARSRTRFSTHRSVLAVPPPAIRGDRRQCVSADYRLDNAGERRDDVSSMHKRRYDRSKAADKARKYAAAGDTPRAIQQYREMVANNPGDSDAWMRIGQLCRRNGAPHDAAVGFLEAARCFHAQGFKDRAAAALERSLRLKPDPRGHIELAAIYVAAGDAVAAEQHFREALAISQQRGLTYEELDAMCGLLEIVDDVDTRVSLARAYVREGMIREARQHFELAAWALRDARRLEFVDVALEWHAIEPENFELNLELARKSLSIGLARRSLEFSKVCYQSRPQDPSVLRVIADTFTALGEHQRAEAVMMRLARAAQGTDNDVRWHEPPRSARAERARGSRHHKTASELERLFQQANVFIASGLGHRAVPLLQSVLMKDPDHTAAQIALKDIMVASERKRDAVRLLVQIARRMARQSRRETALRYLSEAHDLDPRCREILQLVRQITRA